MASLVRSSRWTLSTLCTRAVSKWRMCSNNTTGSIVRTTSDGEVVEHVSPDELVSTSVLNGVPEEQLKRIARIFMPARHAMQSGTANTHCWKMEFDNQERWENPLMGWSSSADPLSCLSLEFDSKEEAIAFVVKNGWGYEVQEPKTGTLRPKSYAENFSWDKKTRVVTK